MVEHLHPAAPTRPALTEAALCAWVGQAYPGEQLVYYVGFLAIDTGPDSTVLTPAARKQFRRVAGRAFQLSEQGLVHLLQRRDALGEYIYVVVARRRPRARAVAGVLEEILKQAGLYDTDRPRRSA